MVKRIFLFFITLVFCLSPFHSANATEAVPESMVHIKRKFSTVALCGVGGAVLGLSTLSFYGEPQEHFSNVWTGLIVGLVAGTAFVITQKDPSKESYGQLTPKKYFPEEYKKTSVSKNRTPDFSFTMSF